MGFREQTQRVLNRFQNRTAGAFPFQPKGEAPPGAPQKRDIPKDFPYDPKALKPLSKALFAASVALGHTLAAHKHFSQVKSPSVSPDGRIGGRGYILAMNEVRRKLWEASEALSAVSDALHDEINAPHWKPKLALLDENDREDVSRFVDEAREVLENPGDEAEEEIEEIDKENDEEDEDEAKGSKLPEGGEPTSQVKEEPTQAKEARRKCARLTTYEDLRAEAENWDPADRAEFEQQNEAWRQSILSGLDSQTGGPRVDDRDPGAGDGPFGSFNPEEDITSDSWGYDGGARGYAYPSEWDNDLREAAQKIKHETILKKLKKYGTPKTTGKKVKTHRVTSSGVTFEWKSMEGFDTVNQGFVVESGGRRESHDNLREALEAFDDLISESIKEASVQQRAESDLREASRLWNPWQDDPRLKGGPSLEDYKTIADLLEKGWPPERILNSPAGRKRHLEMSDIEDAKKMRQRGLVAESQQWAESAMPSDPDTPTDAQDFGIGYGARGEAEARAGEWSPHADLPGVPWQAVGDNTPIIDVNLNERHGLNSLLPGDEAEPVARTDYYRGDRGNLVNVGTESAPAEQDRGLMDTDYVHEDFDTIWLPKGVPGLDEKR